MTKAHRVLAGGLAAQPVHVVVCSVDLDQRRPVHGGRGQLRRFEAGRNERDRSHARRRGVGGGGVGEVSRRGARHRVEPELPSRRQSHRNHPVLEEMRGVAGVVLDVQVGQPELRTQPARVAQRGHPIAEVDRRIVTGRQQGPVPPERPRAPLDVRPGDLRPDPFVVVVRPEGSEALLADRSRLGGIGCPALPASKADQELAHRDAPLRSRFT